MSAGFHISLAIDVQDDTVTVTPCTCPVCIYFSEAADVDDDDEQETLIERELSETTAARLDFADVVEQQIMQDPRARRPARNQGGRSAAPKARPHEKVHHREVKRMKEIEAERAEKLAASLTLFGLDRGASCSHDEWGCTGSHHKPRFTPIDRRDAIDSQHRRHDLAADAARAHGAPLLSAEVSYLRLIALIFSEGF